MKTKKATKKKTKARKRSPRKVADRNDITELMLRDHKPLKQLIKVMKDSDRSLRELRAAFEKFAPLLEAHAHPEQESLYARMQSEGEDELKTEGFEGQVEHGIADMLAKRIPSLDDENEWKAEVKVLAELVEHHIEEEEEDMIPEIRKELELEERVDIGRDYLERRMRYEAAEEAA